MKGPSKSLMKEIAAERISILFSLAKGSVKDEPVLSRSYVKLLRRISTHYRVSLDPKVKNALCKGCDSVLVPGLTADVTLASSKGFAVYKCRECGAERHILYKKQG